MQHDEVLEDFEENPLENSVSEKSNLLLEAVPLEVWMALLEAALHARLEHGNRSDMAREYVGTGPRIVERRKE